MTEPHENVIPLSRPKTDAEKAADFKERVSKKIGELLDIMREAERDDFRVEFQFGRDSTGMPFCVGPSLSKRF